MRHPMLKWLVLTLGHLRLAMKTKASACVPSLSVNTILIPIHALPRLPAQRLNSIPVTPPMLGSGATNPKHAHSAPIVRNSPVQTLCFSVSAALETCARVPLAKLKCVLPRAKSLSNGLMAVNASSLVEIKRARQPLSLVWRRSLCPSALF